MERKGRGVWEGEGDVLKGKWSPLVKVIEESLTNMKRKYVNRMYIHTYVHACTCTYVLEYRSC